MSFPVPLTPFLQEKAQRLGLKPEDVTEQFVRGGGKGGQKINKTSSTVLLRHLPTGIEVRSQRFREQSANRLSAWKLLILKVEQRALGIRSKRVQKMFKLRKQKARRSRRSKEKMLADKRHRAGLKETRKSPM